MMTTDPAIAPTGPDRSRLTVDPRSSAPRPSTTRLGPPGVSSAPRRAPGRGRLVLVALVILAAVGLAGGWMALTRRELDRARIEDHAARLDDARASFDASRARSQAALVALCRLLAEDPRLKATLATADIDAATVDDILRDLGALRGGGFFMVLSPDGRVFAEAGARELRGLDLSGSSIVKRAQREPGAALGAWTVGGAVMDLGIVGLRYGDALIAYLAVGQALDDEAMTALAATCRCDVATTVGDAVAAAATDGDADLFARMAGQPGPWRGRVLIGRGGRQVTSAFELGDVAQSHRLLLTAALDPAAAPVARLGSLLWFPPALVLVAVLCVLLVHRSPRRSS